MLLAAVCFISLAQGKSENNQNQQRKPYFERIQAEKIAFFTSHLNLSVEEAQKFWPVYNEYTKELESVHRQAAAALSSFKKKDLKEADYDKAINDYGKALSKEGELAIKYGKEFKKILSAEKAAKVLNIENEFRMYLLNKLRGEPKQH